MEAKISIIVPALNEERYIRRLLESIRKQTVQPAEVIVADAGSKDKTREVAKQFNCVVVDGGLPAVGRNKGANVAKEDVLLFLDADCVLAKDFIEKTVTEFNERKLDIATCFLHLDTRNAFDIVGEKLTNSYYFLSQKVRPHVYGFCIFARKSVHHKIHGFDETLFVGEDQDYALRARKYGTFGILASAPIYSSMRRFAEDGRAATFFKYAYIELHLLFRGNIRKNFSFKFGKHYKE